MKKILSLIVIVMLSLGLAAFINPIRTTKAVSATMYADPATKYYSYPIFPLTDPVFNISIVVDNLVDAMTITASIKPADITLANITGFWKNSTTFAALGLLYTAPAYTPETGDVDTITGYTSTAFNVTSPAPLFIIQVEGLNFTDPVTIDIYDQYVGGLSGDILTGDCPNDCSLTIEKVTTLVSPTAFFTYSPAIPYESDLITFDASGSTGGFDGVQMTNITEWRWDWNNNGTFTETDFTNSTTYSWPTAGTYTVHLQVYAPAGVGGNVSYVDTADYRGNVTVYATALGRLIDLWTDNFRYQGYTGIPDWFIGILPGAVNGSQVESYSPQDLVCLYAKLTYNGQPIVNKEVEFEADGPINTIQNITIFRQAVTDENGTAYVCFRIPWPSSNAEQIVFGNWTVIAKASVADVEISDTHWFYVHWMVQIALGETVLPNPVHRGELLTVSVNVTNWAMTSRDFILAVTVYDELDVPVAVNYLGFTIAGSGTSGVPYTTSTPYVVTLTIPSWAYVGLGTVYKDVFTKLPWDCGVCWSPEVVDYPLIIAP